MQWIIWAGAAVVVIGLIGIVASIVKIAQARNAGLSDEALRERLNRILPLNLGSFFLGFLGLMIIGIGVMLG